MKVEQKIYISGPITGDPDAKRKFSEAADRLMKQDGVLAVNPFDNGLPDSASWLDHMMADLRMMMTCDAIYMLEGWQRSKGARIEFRAAEEMEMDVLFESLIEKERFIGVKNDNFAARVKAAIREVVGTDFEQYEEDDRSNDVFFMRMIFTYHCRSFGMTLKQIKTYIHRNHTTMLHYLKRYKDEYRYNQQFRDIADQVSSIMSKSVLH